MEDAVVATGMFFEIIYNCANIKADNKILYVSVGWEGVIYSCVFEASWNKTSLNFNQQLFYPRPEGVNLKN